MTASDTVTQPSVKRVKKQYRAKTTWHLQPPPTIDLFFSNPRAWLVQRISRRGYGSDEFHEVKGEDFDRGPVPVVPEWRENLFILRFALVPIALQWAFLKYSGLTIPKLELIPTRAGLRSVLALMGQVFLYQTTSTIYGFNLLNRSNRLMRQYGTFNETHRGRDIVPDSQQRRVVVGLILFNIIRSWGVFALAKDRTGIPALNLWSPVKMGLFMIAMDYFFYVYHRATHDFDCLWWIHRQHHSVRAPTLSMSLLADELQDAIEWVGTPTLAFYFVPLSFAELYLAMTYISYVEGMGHSGIRAHSSHPLLGPILRPFGLELEVEDHDLHHRYGRGGKNFGKQTRIWDVLFGSVWPREEALNYEAKHGKKAAQTL